jgi:hypothetical protein
MRCTQLPLRCLSVLSSKGSWPGCETMLTTCLQLKLCYTVSFKQCIQKVSVQLWLSLSKLKLPWSNFFKHVNSWISPCSHVVTWPKAVIGPGGPSCASKTGARNAGKSHVAEHLPLCLIVAAGWQCWLLLGISSWMRGGRRRVLGALKPSKHGYGSQSRKYETSLAQKL